MRIINFGSGSHGNCTLVSYKDTNIIIDCGINYKYVFNRIKELGIDKIDGLLITHEHNDHIRYLAKFINHFRCNTYIHKASFENINPSSYPGINQNYLCFIEPNYKFKINDLVFVPIELMHDTKANVGYLIKMDDLNMAYITDTGILPDKYLNLLKQMNIIVLESNHDVEMLLESARPYILKQRILSDHGHLSNLQAAQILREVINKETKIVMLAHLSEECNTPELAYDEVIQVINDLNKDVKLFILSQHQETEAIIDD